MHLVDTSIWIEFIRNSDGAHIRFLEDLLATPLAVAITPLVYMEILQGARDTRTYRKLEKYFSGQQFVDFAQPTASHAAAARIYFDCRRQGVAIRSSVDCLIARCAIENNLTLFHHDRDFQHISRVCPSLREKSFLS